MIRRTLRLVPLMLVALLATAAPSQADRTLEIGFEDPAIAPGPAGDAPAVIARWSQMGVQWVRVQAFWNALSPTPDARRKPSGFNVANPNDPRYDWSSLDNAIARVRANGMRVMLTVHQFNPRWASTQPSRARQGWKPSPRLYGQFATALARRYGGQVDRYLLGNEPNQKVFLQPQTECRRYGRRRICERTAANIYRQLVRAAYPAIKRADRSRDEVLLGELAPIGATGPRAGNLAPLPFIRAMGCLDDRYRRITVGACRGFRPARADAFGYHPYQVRERPTQPQRNPALAKLGDLRRLFGVIDRLTGTRRIVAPGRRFNLYITEYGYETNPPDRRNGVSWARQNSYLQWSAYIAWSTPRVKLWTQYLWRDDGFTPSGQLVGFQTGLNTFNGVPKPSLSSFPHPIFIDQRRGRTTRLWGQVRPGGAHNVQIFRQVGGGAFLPWRTRRTDSRGYFSIRSSLARNSNYRFQYTYNGQTFTSDIAHAR
jgi:hypothetical protein